MSKLFFIHIPKTAGSSINSILAGWYPDGKMLSHLESSKAWQDGSLVMSDFACLGGHLLFPEVQRRLGQEWKRCVLLRKPDEHLVSHLAWVRKLAEPGEEVRLGMHNGVVRRIVDQMAKRDLSNPEDLETLVRWLEEQRIMLFHNTQTRYLSGAHNVTASSLREALKSLRVIEYVGVTERFAEFVCLLSAGIGKPLPENPVPRDNANPENFGLDMSEPAIQRVLAPLIACDWISYEYAREVFIRRYHAWLADLELASPLRFSSTNLHSMFSRLKQMGRQA